MACVLMMLLKIRAARLYSGFAEKRYQMISGERSEKVPEVIYVYTKV